MAIQSRGRQVCTCFNVTDEAIAEKLQDCRGNEDERLAALQGSLKCGTNCDSCIPELKRLVRAQKTAVMARMAWAASAPMSGLLAEGPWPWLKFAHCQP